MIHAVAKVAFTGQANERERELLKNAAVNTLEAAHEKALKSVAGVRSIVSVIAIQAQQICQYIREIIMAVVDIILKGKSVVLILVVVVVVAVVVGEVMVVVLLLLLVVVVVMVVLTKSYIHTKWRDLPGL